MPSTHHSLHYHLVFSTKDRRKLISSAWAGRLHAYLGGIIRSLEGVPLIVNGTEDHVHLLVGLQATHRLADVMRTLKGDSSRWAAGTLAGAFRWQDGYGAFTVSPHEVEVVRRYIAGQREHHQETSFEEEYVNLLRQHGVEYDPQYLW